MTDPGPADDRPALDRAGARERDRADPLAALADRFAVPDELYLDGNSLGAMPEPAADAVETALAEWRELGVRGWTDADPPWWHYGERLGDRLAPLVGADPAEVVAASTTTVNIHTLVGTFLDAALGRTTGAPGDGPATGDPDAPAPAGPGVVVDELDFPTDHYAVRGQLRARGLDPGEHLHVVESRDGRTIDEADVEAVLAAEDVGVLFLPSVLYRSGQLLDVERLTAAAHEAGAVAGFDLAHSIGVVDHDLAGAGVDFAVWCSYKYLNGGPGALGGLYVAAEHFGRTPGLPGWWGHEKATQFEMRPRFSPEPAAGGWQIGTVNVLSAAPLFGALEVLDEAGVGRVREKSLALTDYLIALADDRLADVGYSVGTPREPARRGGHVALEHDAAAGIAAALRARGVVVDYRPPNVVRVCPSPLYVGFEDVLDAVAACRAVVEEREYERFADADEGVT